jgi:Domain of unknown function (DUF4381)
MTPFLHVLIALIPATVLEEQKPGRALCRLECNAAEISLSGELRLTVTIEGPAPVEVEIPQPLTASPDWRVRVLPHKAVPLADGRERWEQSFVLEPFQVGRVPLKLEPIHYRTGNEVLDWPLTWKPLEINVVSQVEDLDRTAARPVTDIEIMPQPEPAHSWWYALLIVVPLVVATALLGWVLARTRSAPPERPVNEHVLQELHKLGENGGPTPEQLPQLADALRRYLEWRFAQAATRQTTSEFVASLGGVDGIEPATVKKIESILVSCDLVKFAGAALDRSDCQSLLQSAFDTITQLGQPGATPSAA